MITSTSKIEQRHVMLSIPTASSALCYLTMSLREVCDAASPQPDPINVQHLFVFSKNKKVMCGLGCAPPVCVTAHHLCAFLL